MSLLLFQGGAVKALGARKFGGYGIRFTTEFDPDLENEYFNARSEFWLSDRIFVPVLYSHGKDKAIGKERLGTAKWRKDQTGVWFEGQLEARNEYVEKIMELIRKGVLGFSTAAISNLVQRVEGKIACWLKQWPVYELSLTPTPAEPRTSVMEIKNYSPVSFAQLGQAPAHRRNGSSWERERERTRQLMHRAIADSPEQFSDAEKKRWGFVDDGWTHNQERRRERNLDEFSRRRGVLVAELKQQKERYETLISTAEGERNRHTQDQGRRASMRVRWNG